MFAVLKSGSWPYSEQGRQAAGHSKRDGKQRIKDRRGWGLALGRLRSCFVHQSWDDTWIVQMNRLCKNSWTIIVKKMHGQPPELWGVYRSYRKLCDAVNLKLLQNNHHIERKWTFGGFFAMLPELAPDCMFELALFDSVSSGNAAPSCALRITQ